MDFSTGSGPERPTSSGDSGQGQGVPTPTTSGGAGSGDFNLSDPVQSFVRTTREVLLNPVGFFRSIPRQGGFLPPLAYALICSVIAGVLSGIGSLLLALIGDQGVGAAIGVLFTTIIITPIATAVGLFIAAGIYHLLVWLLVKPSNAGFEATFRVVAYASALQLLSWLAAIPILGILVAVAIGIYNIVLSVLGIREVHSTSTGKAALIVLIPVAIGIVLGLLIAAVVIAIIAAALNQ